MKKKRLYVSPKNEVIYTLEIDLICTSPDYGGTEDVGYDDWVKS